MAEEQTQSTETAGGEQPPPVDTAALLAELAELRGAKEEAAKEKNLRLSAEARIEQASKDPDAALALADLDFDEYTKKVLSGEIKPRSKEARKQAAEVDKLKQAEAELEKLRKDAKDRETREAVDRELAAIRAEIKEEEHPLVKLLGLEHQVHVRFYENMEKTGQKPALKDVIKEIHDEVFGITKTVLTNPHSLKALLADKEIVAKVQEAMGGASASDAKKVIKALGSVASAGDKSKAAPEKKEERKKTPDETATEIADRIWKKHKSA